MKSTLKFNLLLGATVAAMSLTAYADGGRGDWPYGFTTHIKTAAEAEASSKAGHKVALACKDCNTVNAKSDSDKKGILAWFAPDSKHDCGGCGGKITVTTVGGGKIPSVSEYKHTCSKCGPDSAFTCATHKKG
ncbi:MAG: hypothetical protein H8M99_13580 [Gloeobacteraceae cyanobacterium ES-bin-144]|nr:hypothetical protein [Verrucomicrobiales bacterium]